MSEIGQLWERLEDWASTYAPEMIRELAPPASEDEIADVEDQFGIPLSKAFKDCLRIHNGETDGWPSRVFADMGAYLPTQRIVDEWESRRSIACDLDDMEDPDELIRDGIIEVSGPVQPVMFHDAWLPIMECNGDVFWALDFAPGDGGADGQVIEVDWEGCSWKVIADSFQTFVENYVNELESGSYRIDEGLPTKEKPPNEHVPRTLQKIEDQPELEDLKHFEIGDPIDLIVSALAGFDTRDTYTGLEFKISGGFVILIGALATGDDSVDKPPHYFYKIKAQIAKNEPELILDVRKFEILEGHDEI